MEKTAKNGNLGLLGVKLILKLRTIDLQPLFIICPMFHTPKVHA